MTRKIKSAIAAIIVLWLLPALQRLYELWGFCLVGFWLFFDFFFFLTELILLTLAVFSLLKS